MFTEHHTGEVNTVNDTLHANNNPFEKAFTSKVLLDFIRQGLILFCSLILFLICPIVKL